VRRVADGPCRYREAAARAAPPPAAPRTKAAAVTNLNMSQAPLERLSRLRLEPNPALVREAQQRAQSMENRVADRITGFAGSMQFVYLHLAWFGCWIGFGVEHYPYGLLTMVVSLEAIFLSTFVMISQNRADEKRQAIADQQWQTVKDEDRQNEELLELSRQILDLTKAIRAETTSRPPA
jgi:uncharacterized membrane protein